MKTLHIFRFLLVLVMISVTLGVASLARAGGDTHYQIVIPVDETMYSGTDNPCGFEHVVHDTGNLRINYWLDDNGRLTKEIDIWGNLKRTLSANGKTLRVHISGPLIYDARSETEINLMWPGPGMLITAPGYGHVLGGAGLFIEKYTLDLETGEWIYTVEKYVGNFSWDDWSDFCEYLSP